MLFAPRVARLNARLSRLPSLLVALSGGVDSAVLLAAAAGAVKGRLLAATAVSPAVPPEEVVAAEQVARRFGVAHRKVSTDELADERYRRNDGDRCYFCRQAMYGGMSALAQRHGIAAIADGLQADDRTADRPGVKAAQEWRVLHPLREAGLGKADVRRLARAFGLALHAKPAAPCLASRLPLGVPVSEQRLRRVHRAERALRERGFSVLRVRCEERHGRIEIGQAELARARAMAAELEALVVRSGFTTAALDPLGYR